MRRAHGGAAVYSGSRNSDGGETQIVSDVVRDSSVQPSGNVTTTYDKLIQNYADLHARLIDATIVQGQAQEILDIYADVTQDTDPRSAEAQWASARIDELVQKFTSLYDLALMTIDEFNQVNGADNIEMKNSIVVTEKLNLKLYAALSVVLFLFVGCFCAIFLGRLGDFVDYYLYVDKKSGLPNRERCDAAIDHYSTTRLKGQFTIICIQLDFSAMSRNDGDKALRLLGDQLQYVFRTLGFVSLAVFGLLCGRKEGIILRQLTFAANLATINKVSVREWRNGRRAGFRHQFQRSEGSTPFSRIKNGPKLRLGVIFYLAEKRGRTARPPDGSYHDMDK